MVVFFCKQKTAYEMRISDWSSDVCSSDLVAEPLAHLLVVAGDQPRKKIVLLDVCMVGDEPGDAPGRRCHRHRVEARLRGQRQVERGGQPGRRHRGTEERRVGKERVSEWSTWWAPARE